MAYGRWAMQQGENIPGMRVRAPVVAGKPVDPLRVIMGRMMAGFMIFFSFQTAGATALSILREDEDGTLARLFTTPSARSQVLGGKFLSVLLTVILQIVVLMISGMLLFGIHWGGLLRLTPVVLGIGLAAGRNRNPADLVRQDQAPERAGDGRRSDRGRNAVRAVHDDGPEHARRVHEDRPALSPGLGDEGPDVRAGRDR